MQQKRGDITPLVDPSSAKGTGPFRTWRPVYVDLLPPCNNACPAGEHIQAWLALAQAGKFRAAWEMLVKDNPLPAVHGRVCYHPCESACNREALDAAVNIHSVERFLGDLATAENWKLPIAAPPRQAGAGHRRRAERAIGRVSSRAAGSRRGDRGSRTGCRRHDAFRHPRLSAAPRGSDEGDPPDRGNGGGDHVQSQSRGC